MKRESINVPKSLADKLSKMSQYEDLPIYAVVANSLNDYMMKYYVNAVGSPVHSISKGMNIQAMNDGVTASSTSIRISGESKTILRLLSLIAGVTQGEALSAAIFLVYEEEMTFLDNKYIGVDNAKI